MTLTHTPWASPSAGSARLCVSDASGAYSYADIERWTAAAAEQFSERGLRAGDVLGIMLPNSVELLVGMLAAWRLGAAATPLNPSFTTRERDYQLRDSGARLLLALPGTESDIEVVRSDELRTVPLRHAIEPALDPQRIALLVYTSGSTGEPKGVMLDHANLAAMATQTATAFELTSDDHALLVLPLFHVNSIVTSFLSPLVAGGQLTILERFAPDTFVAALHRTRPTYFSAVPAIYARLVSLPQQVDLRVDSLRFAICGAAPASKELLDRVEHRMGVPLIEGYGLTEGTCASAVNPLRGVRKPGTVGKAIPGQRVGIMSADGTLLPPGERGEVVISGPTVMRGYLGRPDATAETIRDGWLHTGDVGVLDEDGYLTIVDRIKDMIIRGGENLYPKEIEAYLASHPDVLEAAVIGIPHDVLGEVPAASVVLAPGATATGEDLIAHCRRGLTKIKVPERIDILDELPRNPVGKVDKPRMRREAAAA